MTKLQITSSKDISVTDYKPNDSEELLYQIVYSTTKHAVQLLL